jgi:uncharacterized membrane-anchored protein
MGGLGIFALIVLLVLVAAMSYAVVWLAMLPGKIAVRRKHPQADAIRVAGWLGILTGIVWIIAVIWAYTSVEGKETATVKVTDSVEGGVS